MIIKEVSELDEANICDDLLTKLILDEKKYNENINENFTVRDYYKNYIGKDDSKLLIAKVNDEIVGFIFTKIIVDETEKKSSAKIDALYVTSEKRNLGIATKLIENTKNWLKEKNVSNITINVIYENEIAKKLYNKLGFKNYYVTLKCSI